MARQTKRLTARTVATLTKVGRYGDGGNLYLTISKTGNGLSKRWTFMFVFAGRQREAGSRLCIGGDPRPSAREGRRVSFHAREGH